MAFGIVKNSAMRDYFTRSSIGPMSVCGMTTSHMPLNGMTATGPMIRSQPKRSQTISDLQQLVEDLCRGYDDP